MATPGRPKIDIDEDKVRNLRSLGFNWKRISELLHVSYSKLNSWKVDHAIESFSDITDQELDGMILEILEGSPNSGERMIIGAIQAKGMNIQRFKIRESLDRVKPDRNSLAKHIKRRVYNVPFPNALWHLDGNHKLIRWRFVIHGCIDGYSRVIVFLKCATNNKAMTVMNNFLECLNNFRCPLRIRTDHGLENVRVAEWMLERHGAELNPVLTGKSVHNQRIERLWLDVKVKVNSIYIDLFRNFEESGILDPANEIHLFALHYVYQPRINKKLEEFSSSWNNHPIRTERNSTPFQLWIGGFYKSLEEGILERTNVTVNEDYGVEGFEDDDYDEEEEDFTVEVPPVFINLNEEQQLYITEIDPLREDGEDGRAIFLSIVNYLENYFEE